MIIGSVKCVGGVSWVWVVLASENPMIIGV